MRGRLPPPRRRGGGSRRRDIRYWHEPDRGGHFPAAEQPGLFTAELPEFFSLVR
ncbi:hypothetical protein OHT93_01525 [Streptomyces sp. NBC_00191]|uniref:hypothetical protein n=1 Tax=Streptomyces sp. NBC_00191 TaxID=2975674 RepID=UPI00324428D1